MNQPTTQPIPQPNTSFEPPPMPMAARGIVLAFSSALLLSAVAGAFMAIRADPAPQWGAFGFEIVVTVASVFGIFLGLGRFQAGCGIAAAMIALAWFVGTGMGRLPFHNSPRGVITDPWFLGRLVAACAVALAGALTVLSRDSRAWKRLMIGLALLAPVGLFLAFWFVTGGGWLGNAQTGGLEVVRNCILFLIVVVCGGLFCFGADSIIRAFGYGIPAGQPGAPLPDPTKRPVAGSE